MKTAIIYISRRGTTLLITNMITAALTGRNVTSIDLDQYPEPDLDHYQEIIIGGPIYMGELPQKLRAFCQTNIDKLMSKRLGLFVCGMIPDKTKQEEELNRAYPEPLRQKARVAAFLGGAFVQDKLNLFEKLIVRFIAKTRKSVSKIEQSEIESFCRRFIRNS